ncbi:MAM and LDL-receptor class A domain-containing protein 1-like [Mytilus trossulus]|uniref:MAM and LDL-receptor class A domain-containing protein 1-like n=1 Tax=Mytilus trossulus TaxID=6551 RepID=UPI003003D371
MKITLFCVSVFWTICTTTSREIPHQYSRNARIAKELNELEHLLKEREYVRQGRFGKRHLDRPSKSYARKMEEGMQNLTQRKRLLAERKMKEWRKSNGDLPEPENIDPDDPESNLLEGMEIENNGHPHLGQGLHPENSAKTYGDSHDSHKLIPEQEVLAKKSGYSSGRKRNFDTYTPWLWKDGIAPYNGTQTCTFEDGAPCFLVEATNDDFDWTLRSGSTPSGGTGPQSAVEGSKYKYVEVSSPRASNDIARLESSTNLNAGDYCLTFQYHMFGLDTMGDLKISTGVTAPENEVFIESGNLGDQWNKGNVTISNAAGMKLFIEANKVTSWKGDIAIDDIQLMPGVCAGVSPCDYSPCRNGGSCSESTTAIGYTCSCLSGFVGQHCAVDGKTVSEFTCGFETENNCVFENVDDDDFQWTYLSGSTPSGGTGPSSAYEGTQYVYTEASSPNFQGDTAVLSTVNTLLAGTSSYCLKFYLHMYGAPGTMEVKFGNRGSSSSSVWSKSADQGNQWVFHQVELPPSFADPVIFFEATRGSSYKGDVALDSVKLSLGQCACATNPCNNGGSCNEDGSSAGYYCNCMTGWSGDNCDVQDSYSCGFETAGATCIFQNADFDNFDWTRHTKSTPSPFTGPSGAATGDYYMYIETSAPRVHGDAAVLTTHDTILHAGSWCLTFQYHMYGFDIGSLIVLTEDSLAGLMLIWIKSGMQSHPTLWKTATMDIPQLSDPVIIIIGIRGGRNRDDNLGDIAIDDIALNAGTCASAGK